MAITPDRIAEKRLQQQIAAAKKQLENGSKSKLTFSGLAEKPRGLNGTTKAFEFRSGIFLRMCVQFRDKWIEVMPVSATSGQKQSVAESLGFNAKNYRKEIVHPPEAYLRERVYFVEK